MRFIFTLILFDLYYFLNSIEWMRSFLFFIVIIIYVRTLNNFIKNNKICKQLKQSFCKFKLHFDIKIQVLHMKFRSNLRYIFLSIYNDKKFRIEVIIYIFVLVVLFTFF
jgi:hypothetical protein